MDFFKINIRLLRKARGWKQGQTAAAIGFSRAAWGNYETGRSVPTFEDLKKIARIFNVTLTQLVETDLRKNSDLLKQVNNKIDIDTSPLNEVYDNEEVYLLDAKIVEQRLNEKDEVIAALRGQIEALKILIGQLRNEE